MFHVVRVGFFLFPTDRFYMQTMAFLLLELDSKVTDVKVTDVKATDLTVFLL